MNETSKLLEIRLLVDQKVIEETLTRIGIVDKKKNIIYQSCHLLKHFDTFFLAHFKQLFVLSTDKNGYPGFGNVSLEDINEKLAVLIDYYNNNITSYNKLITMFPTNIVAKINKYKTKLFFDMKDMSDNDYNDFKL